LKRGKFKKNRQAVKKSFKCLNCCVRQHKIYVAGLYDMTAMPTADQLKEVQRSIAVYDDEKAYKELFFIFYKTLTQFAFSFVKSKEMSEEIVSDVFINIWKGRKQLEEIDNLKTYLYISTKNIALKYLLKQHKQVAIGIDSLNIELESKDIHPDQLMITSDMVTKISEAVNQLPPRCKLIYKFIKEDGLRYKEVAAILNISVKTIDNQLAIAVKKIGAAINVNLKRQHFH
jgi:RNA polymerase sigma-70 factor (ECF subfamily)